IRSCGRTGRWACGVAPWREPYELRGSSTVLREPRGEIPRGYSPNAAIARASRSNRWLNSVFETLIATTRPRIPRLPRLTHPACADAFEYLVRPESGSGAHCEFAPFLSSDCQFTIRFTAGAFSSGEATTRKTWPVEST